MARSRLVINATKYPEFMNVITKAWLLIGLIIILQSCFMFHEGISHFNDSIDLAIREQEEIITNVFGDINRYVFDAYRFKISHFIEENQQILQAFALRDRDLLYRLSASEYNYLHDENPNFYELNFILPDSRVLLQVQKPELFGDDVGAKQLMVADGHKPGQQRAGFDFGERGAMFRIEQPVHLQGNYLGLVEFGIEVRQLEKALSASLKSVVTTLVKAGPKKRAALKKMGFQEYGDAVLMTDGSTPFDRIAPQLDFSKLERQRVSIDGRSYVLHCCTLQSDHREEQIGGLILLQDISELVARKRAFILHSLLLTAGLLILSYLTLNFLVSGLIDRFVEHIRENAQYRKKLRQSHDLLEDRVKELTVELAKSNARLDDEATIRRRSEARLGGHLAFLETIIEAMTTPFYVIDAESYVIIMANKAARALTNAESTLDLTCYRLTHHSDQPCSSFEHPCPLIEVKKTGQPVVLEHIHYDQDNQKQIVEIYAYPIFDQHGKVVQVVEYTIDITVRKKVEEEKENLRSQLLASQKMETVGILAGGIAHDFNNILTVILGYTQIMALTYEETHPMREMVNEIYDAADRAAGLTRQLLAFSRKQVMEIKIVNPNAVVQNISKILGRLIGEDVRLRIALAETIGNIKADAGQIQQVIMNLVINARDAMPEGGTMSIETGQIELDEKYTARHPSVRPGLYVMITVTDTGIGMTPEVREQIFEPFFTTKKRGEGTGLGLSTVHGIVNQHNGHIYVYSEPGRGTTFKIYLPVTVGSAEELVVQDTRSMPLGEETILLVDDDASIRRLLRDTLEPLGYNLLEACSGEDALALLGRTAEKIDLVFTDLIMPGMNGQELIDAIRAEHPETKFILMSGYTDNILQRHNVFHSGVVFISKPLLPIALANRVREVLDEAAPYANTPEPATQNILFASHNT